MPRLLPLLLLGPLLGLAACSASGAEEGSVRVATSVYPMEFIAEEIGGGSVEVANVTPPGAEPHDVELSSDQVIQIAEADLVVYVGGDFQPAVEESLDEATGETLDAFNEVSSGLAIMPDDFHFWLDPRKLAQVAKATSHDLQEIDPQNGATYEAAADDLVARLDELEQAFRSGLRDCESYDIVTSHEAFGQLGNGLTQRGISGLDPEAEPTPQRIVEMIEFVRANDVTTLFAEPLLPPDAAEAIAQETGAKVAILDPLESEPESGDYFSAMERNLETLREALRCR